MKILFLILFLFSPSVYAFENYAVEREDGGVTIVNYDPASISTLEDVLKDFGLENRPYKKITPSDVPPTKEDREFWKIEGKKVIVDTAKKQAKEAEKLAKQAEKDAILLKLKLSKEEAEKVGLRV